MFYAWDPAKAATNLRKHGILFVEAASVFLDPLARTSSDPDHQHRERRLLTIGVSARGRIIIVAHAELADNCIRIISARKATKRESNAYREED